MLRISNTDELPQGSVYRVFLYGDNRSGKTHFAGTWPNPVFIVPKIGLNEMKTLKGQDIAVIPFAGLEDCEKQISDLVKEIKSGSKRLPYVPKTLVFDNLTTANQLWLEELEDTTSDERKVQRNKWGLMRSYVVAFMRMLHGVTDCHVIWICHPRVEKVQERVGGRTEEHSVGSFTVQGAARELIPGNCDLLLYAEDKDLGVKGTGYFLHGRKRGIWPAGVRLSRVQQKTPFTVLGPKPSPSYDELAKILGIPSRDEIEDQLAE